MFICNTGALASASSSRPLLFTLSLALAVSAALFAAPRAALAQSSGTQATEEELTEVTVTARKVRNLAGVTEQDAAKSRVSVTAESLQSQSSGQSIFQGINLVPGVNFTNTDPYGGSGGNLRIRSFDGSRVSVTFDGIPLNDSGNYALFTQQMLDTELVDRIDVNLGTTDVDSPTASATGGTVAYRTIKPRQQMGGTLALAGGDNNYRRAFGIFHTGAFGPWGTTAFISASSMKYDKFKGPGELNKKQVNLVVRQDFDGGNYLSVAAHFNRARNSFYRTASALTYAQLGRDYDYTAVCNRDAPTAGVADNDGAGTATFTDASGRVFPATDNPANPASCTNYYGVRDNPSETGNIRAQSLWHLGEQFIFTLDPSIQYVLANGGGSTTLRETPLATDADKRVIGTAAVTGLDLNGDGDLLDTIRFYTPNNTNTYRLGVNSSLIWKFAENQNFRIAYALDRARHRQTAQWGLLDLSGNPENVFAGRKGTQVLNADGSVLRGRDRYSIAELNQFSAEYRGKFMDDKFTATVGIRAPFFKRELNQYCYSLNGGNGNSGNLLCTTQVPVATLTNGNVIFVPATVANPNPVQYIPPYKQTVKFDDILPNLGFTYSPWDSHTFYISYAGNLSAPRTDNLYAVRRLADNSIGRPIPDSETTKSYDLGWRYNTPNVLASVALWKSKYNNRIVASFDPDLGFSVDRNVGDVDLKGVDMQVGWQVTDAVTLSASSSYTKTKLLSDIQTSATVTLSLKGKQLVETPKWTFGVRGDFRVGENLRFGIDAKRVGDRFATDLNDEIAPSYTVMNADLRYNFHVAALKSLSLKLNVINLLDEAYFGNISSGTGGTSVGFYSIGAPRTLSLSLEASL